MQRSMQYMPSRSVSSKKKKKKESKSNTRKTPSAGEDGEQREFSFTIAGQAKWSRDFGRRFDSV